MHGEGMENRRFGRGEVSYKSTQKPDFIKKVGVKKALTPARFWVYTDSSENDRGVMWFIVTGT
jgi:hypothetical protein